MLGYLDPDFFAGGKMKLDAAAARAAIEEQIARAPGLSVEEAAAGMYRVINENMAHGVREITVKRGFDPREFPMIAAGGAGPIHALPDRAELEIPLQIGAARVLHPLRRSACCCRDLQHDFVRTFVARLETLDWARLEGAGRRDDRRGRRGCSPRSASPRARRQFELRLDLPLHQAVPRGVGPDRRAISMRGATRRRSRALPRRARRLYGYSLEAESTPVELINVRLQAIGATEKPTLSQGGLGGRGRIARPQGPAQRLPPRARRPSRTCPCTTGTSCGLGNRIAGPAIIEQVNTAMFVSAAYDCAVDAFGTFAVYRRGRETLVKLRVAEEVA